MDRVTKTLLDEFVADNGLDTLPEDRAFEHFCGSLITSAHYSESFPSEDISVGSGADCGIDCVAIIVNGSLVTNPEEVEDLASTNNYLDATFVFVQAERSSAFEAAKIGQFGFGVQDFFSDPPKMPQNESVKLCVRIANELFNRSSKFKGNPQCFLYYATTGRWIGDQNLTVRKDAVVKDLLDLNMFRRVQFDCVDADKIQALYRQSKNSVRAEITFAQKTTLPDLQGVTQAYLGILPAMEFLKLVENENQEIIKSIFYDNVRDWQEWNLVNTGMRETLEDPAKRRYFPLLNNGVTIVARQVSPTGNRILVEDYQVVNGCQTTHVLHEMRANLSDDVFVPVRLIATQDADIRNSILKATNRQTQVPDEQLFAAADFPKKLESYFPTFDAKKRLYYERRSRQYAGTAGIEKVRVIDMRTLVRAFASIFLELPHRTTRNYAGLLKQIGVTIFHKDHRLEPYYVASYAHYRLESLFRKQILPADLKPARYHILLAFRLLHDPAALPTFNSHEMERACDTFMALLWDEDRSRQIFEQAAEHVKAVAAGDLQRDNIRTEPFTDKLVRRFRPAPGLSPTA